MILARLISLVIGYAFGLFQTAYIIGRTKGVDIRKEGSGNAGTTNSLRVLGAGAGALTFLGDVLKEILAMVLVMLIFHNMYPDATKLLALYAGFGAVLGHNFPFYLNFKGGKGIACTAAMMIMVSVPAAMVCLLVFIVTVLLTRYVSLGSILIVSVFFTLVVVFNHTGIFAATHSHVLEFDIVTGCFAALAIYRHRANIVRLIQGKENKFSIKH